MNRVLSGLSQTELAKELGVSASFIGCVERDEKSLSLENLMYTKPHTRDFSRGLGVFSTINNCFYYSFKL